MGDREQQEAAAEGIEEAIAWSTLGIVCGFGANQWREIGTGTLIRWKGMALILTAEHVIRGTLANDLRFFFREDAPLVRMDREDLLALPGVPTRKLRPFTAISLAAPIADPRVDLAAIPVSGTLDNEHPVRYFDLQPGGNTPDEGHCVIAMGYPHDISRVTHADERVVFTSVEWTEIDANRTGLRDFDPETQFLARYRLTDYHPNADPHGFSGCAMWFRRGPTPGVWHPNLDIAGVTVGFYRQSSLLSAVRREAMETFLESHVG